MEKKENNFLSYKLRKLEWEGNEGQKHESWCMRDGLCELISFHDKVMGLFSGKTDMLEVIILR